MKYSKELVTELYQELLSVRMAEEKLVEIYALGKVPGHIHSGVGEEAAYVAPLMTRREGDYYKHTHRVVAAAHAVGVTFNEMFAEILGKQTGTSHGRGGVNHIARLDKGCIGTAGSLGVDTEVAIGAGLSAKYLENGRIVYCYNGDGTHSRHCTCNVVETQNCSGGTATCTQRATCTVCGAEYGDVLGHDFTTSWTHDDNEHWKQCSRCDAKDDVSPHTWDNGTITTAPTCTKAGEETYSHKSGRRDI